MFGLGHHPRHHSARNTLALGDATQHKAIYSLTGMGSELLPIVAEISRWSRKYRPVDPQMAATGEARDLGEPGAVAARMKALRAST